jgi:hypothetical protein
VFIGGTATGLLIAAMFGILCYVNTWTEFASFLAIYLTINVISWQYMIKIVLTPTFKASEETYRQRKKFAHLEQLYLVYKQYLCGKWQWARFITGGFIVVLMNWLSFRYRRGESVMQIGPKFVELELLISLTILLFVVVMETWIWFWRLRVKTGLRILKNMKDTYRFDLIE